MLVKKGLVANRRTGLPGLRNYIPYYPGEIIYLNDNPVLPSIKNLVLVSTDGSGGRKTLPVNKPIITTDIVNLTTAIDASYLEGAFCYSIDRKKFYILGRPSMVLEVEGSSSSSGPSASPTEIDGGIFT